MRKWLSCCSIWVLFEKGIKTQKVSRAVLCKARTVFSQELQRWRTAVRATRKGCSYRKAEQVQTVSASPSLEKRARRSEYVHSSLVTEHQCIRRSSEVDGRGFYSLSGLGILRGKYWLQNCLKYPAENINNLIDIPIPQICIDMKYSRGRAV
jgi:hypothetical protein